MTKKQKEFIMTREQKVLKDVLDAEQKSREELKPIIEDFVKDKDSSKHPVYSWDVTRKSVGK